MNTSANVTLDIPSDWNESRDAAYYKAEYGQMSGDPHDNMKELFKKTSAQFESCLDHSIKFILDMDRLESFGQHNPQHLLKGPGYGEINDALPPTNEAKIMMLREALNKQRRPCSYHQTFNGALDYCLAIEMLRQRVASKLSCPDQRIVLREISEVVGLMDLAMQKLDSAFDHYYGPFYHQYSVRTIPAPERLNHKRLMKVLRRRTT